MASLHPPPRLAGALLRAARTLPGAARRPAPQTRGVTAHWLTTADGVRISARHDPHAAADTLAATITPAQDVCFVVAHGFTGSWRRPDIRRIVHDLAAFGGVVSFDFRGHGQSGGQGTVGDREVLDLDAVLLWARELGYRRIVAVGFSMGAAVTLRQAAMAVGRDGVLPDAVVAVSGPGRWYFRGTTAMRRLHRGIETRLGRAVLRRVFGTRVSGQGWPETPLPPTAAAAVLAASSDVAILLVHGDADHYFPVDHAEALLAACGGADRAELWLEPGMGHGEGATDAALAARVARWASAAVGPARGGLATRPTSMPTLVSGTPLPGCTA